jgi:hypothetical protein
MNSSVCLLQVDCGGGPSSGLEKKARDGFGMGELHCLGRRRMTLNEQCEALRKAPTLRARLCGNSMRLLRAVLRDRVLNLHVSPFIRPAT